MFTEPTPGESHLKRKDTFEAYDICDCTNYPVTALEDTDDGVTKVEFDDNHILYAQYITDDEEAGYPYWEIDSGDCH